VGAVSVDFFAAWGRAANAGTDSAAATARVETIVSSLFMIQQPPCNLTYAIVNAAVIPNSSSAGIACLVAFYQSFSGRLRIEHGKW
jgi:hypothetical protein